MLEVTIDATGLDALDLSEDVLAGLPGQLAGNIGNALFAYWNSVAEQKLDTSKAEYKAAMGPDWGVGPEVVVGPRRATITLALDPNSEVANIVETGQAAGVQQFNPGQKIHELKDEHGRTVDRYQNIMFRHASPPKEAAHLKKPQMGASHIGLRGRDNAFKLGQAIYRKMRRIATKQGPGASLPSGVGGAEILKPQHKSDIYGGMRQTGKGQYRTWRTLWESKPWARDGVEARHLLNEVEQKAESIIRPIVEGYLSGQLGAAKSVAKKAVKIR